MKGFDEFENEFRMQAMGIFKCQQMPKDLKRIFQDSPLGLRAYFERVVDAPECLESSELESCEDWATCNHLSECVRGYAGRLAAGWLWNQSEAE